MLLDVWGDDTIQTQLNRVYRSDSVFQKIVAALATRGFKRSGKKCRDKLKEDLGFTHSCLLMREPSSKRAHTAAVVLAVDLHRNEADAVNA